jgi:hypothetical protein
MINDAFNIAVSILSFKLQNNTRTSPPIIIELPAQTEKAQTGKPPKFELGICDFKSTDWAPWPYSDNGWHELELK